MTVGPRRSAQRRFTVPFRGISPRRAVLPVLLAATLLSISSPTGSPTAVLSSAPDWDAEGDQIFAAFGVSVIAAGDVNGDGYDDLLVGASLSDASRADEGQVFLFLGSASGLSRSRAWFGAGGQKEAWLGFTVAAGDINGDGIGDVVAGAHGFDLDVADQGIAYSWLGGEDLPASEPDWFAAVASTGAFFGKAMASGGDVDGDGFDDILVGAFGLDEKKGGAFLYRGTPQGAELTPVWSFLGIQIGAAFGFSVAFAGDVNGDGFDDILVGAHLEDAPSFDEGRAYLFLGSAAGPDNDPVWITSGLQPGAHFGQAVSAAGDVNRDGFDDVLVGAPAWDEGEADEGGVFLYLGSAGGLEADPIWIGQSNDASAAYGSSVAAAGDVNSDGFDDILIGAPLFDSIVFAEGRAFLYLGSPSGPSHDPAWTADGFESGDFFGGSVSGAGDVNGDGVADVAVGSQAADDEEFVEGRAFVYHGIPASSFFLEVGWTGDGGGTVISSPTGIDCGVDCSEIYDNGTTVVLTALPDQGAVFGGWSGDADCMDGIVEMTAARSCSAFFPLASEFCADQDQDGYGSPGSDVCSGGPVSDCNDDCPSCFPGAPEVCDGTDNSCDGDVDVVACDRFDVDGNGMIDGVELAWLGRAFGETSSDPAAEWWYEIDYTGDGVVDGDDLGILATVWFCVDARDVCDP